MAAPSSGSVSFRADAIIESSPSRGAPSSSTSCERCRFGWTETTACEGQVDRENQSPAINQNRPYVYERTLRLPVERLFPSHFGEKALDARRSHRRLELIVTSPGCVTSRTLPSSCAWTKNVKGFVPLD